VGTFPSSTAGSLPYPREPGSLLPRVRETLEPKQVEERRSGTLRKYDFNLGRYGKARLIGS